MNNKILNNKFYPIIFLTIIVFVSIFLLMLVNNITSEKIRLQEEEKILLMLRNIFPDMSNYELKDDIYIVYKDKETIGYAFIAVGKGYGGEINTFVGIDKDFTIKQITVISNSETPGLGAKITESFFTDQFKGLRSSDVKLNKDGGKIDAITGATISSRAVTDSVRQELDKNIEIIKTKNY